MTTLQLRAELFREMNPLLDNETAMKRLLAFVRGLMKGNNSEQTFTDSLPREGWAEAAKKAHEEGQDQLLVDDVFADESMEEWQW